MAGATARTPPHALCQAWCATVLPVPTRGRYSVALAMPITVLTAISVGTGLFAARFQLTGVSGRR